MPTLRQIIDEHEAGPKMDYMALAEMSENWNMPQINPEPSAMKDVISQEQGRRYQGFWDDLGRAGVGGTLNVSSGMTGTTGRNIKAVTSSRSLGPLVNAATSMWWEGTKYSGVGAFGVQEKVAEPLIEVSKRLFEESQKKKWQPSVGGGWKGYVASAVGATGPYMFAAALASAATGSPVGAFGVGFGVETESIYRELPEDMPESQKRLISSVGGTISASIEAFQIGEIYMAAGFNKAAITAMKKAATEKSLAKLGAATGKLTTGIVMNAIGEGTQEALQEMTSNASLIYGTDMEATVENIFKNTGKAFVGGATVGSILSGAVTPFKIAADGTVTQSDSAPLTPQEVAIQEKEAQILEAAKVEKAVKKAVTVAATPIETEDTQAGSPPLENTTNAVVEQETTVTNNMAEGKPPTTDVYSPRQDIVSSLLLDMGQDIPSSDKQSFAQWANEAVALGFNKRENAMRIAESVIANERAMTPQESAGITLAVRDIALEMKDVNKKIVELGDGPDIDGSMATAQRLEAEQSRLTTTMANALYTSGSERGRALVSQKFAIDQSGDIVSMKAKARRSKGSPLTEVENKKLEDQAAEIDKLKAELSELQKQSREANAETVFKSVKKKKGKKVTKTEMTIQEKAAEVRKLFKDGCVL